MVKHERRIEKDDDEAPSIGMCIGRRRPSTRGFLAAAPRTIGLGLGVWCGRSFCVLFLVSG